MNVPAYNNLNVQLKPQSDQQKLFKNQHNNWTISESFSNLTWNKKFR